MFLLAFLETNPCPTLYPTYPLFPETIKRLRYCMFPGSLLTPTKIKMEGESLVLIRT